MSLEVVRDEEVLLVPKEFAEFSLGFVVDAGGSVTKLIYRSKQDYENGILKEANATKGKLRLRYFRLGRDQDVIAFIKENCDILESSKHTPGKDGPAWYQTGVYTQFFKTVLEEAIGIKTTMFSEVLAMTKITEVCKTIPELKCPEPFVESADYCLKSLRTFLGVIQSWKECGDDTFDNAAQGGNNEEVSAYIAKYMTIDAESFAKELAAQTIQYPCLITLVGSASGTSMVYEDGKIIPVFFNTMSGKTFQGLGEALTGAKDFNELIEMASRGKHSKVDIMCGDLKNKNHTEKDWYSSMPDDYVTFALGKLTSNPLPDEVSYSKDDIAAGVLHLHCVILAKIALLNARLHKVKSVVFCGSFVNPPMVRQTLEQYFLGDSMMQLLEGNMPTSVHFLPHPGFICGLGVWAKNLEVEKQLKTGK